MQEEVRKKVPDIDKNNSESLYKEQNKLSKREQMTKGTIEILDYLDKRHIPEFLSFLMNHLIVTRPIEPFGYLYDLLDKCLLFRAGLIEPPLFFNLRNIESVFKRFDPEGLDSISLNQYALGMKMLNIDHFNPNPIRCRCTSDKVDKETFETEALRCLIKMLNEMIGIS